MPPIAPRVSTGRTSMRWYVTLAEYTSNIMSPPLPNSPHFPLKQKSIRARSTIATTAVVKKDLQRRALLHLQKKMLTLMLKKNTKDFFMRSDRQQKLCQTINSCIDMNKDFSFKP